MIAEVVYILCAVTSLGCAWMLQRGYRSTRSQLLFWSGACFICLGVSNVLLFVDFVMLPRTDLSTLRNCITLAGLLMLLYGMVRDTV